MHISVAAVALLALAGAARAHQPLSAAADDNDCALYLSGPGRTSAFDYNLNLLRGNFGYDGQHTCITYDAVNQAYLDARKRINVAQPKGDWKAEDIASAGELMLDISISLARTYGLTYEEIEKGLPLIDTAKTLIREACPPIFSHVECRPGKYRRFDGLCNNLQHPTWGATMAPFQRLIGPLFADGINAPRISTSGRDLPLSRVVSRTMHPDDGFHDHAGTVMVIAWGQFMDHDYTLTATPLDPRNRNDPEECCKRPPHLKHPYCNEIRIPDDDYFYRLFHVKCIDFVRGFPSPRPGCRLGSRVPFNTLTGVLDGNTVYGVTEKFARKLRTGFGGLLRMNPVFEEYGLKDLLPLKLDIPDEGCTRPNKSMFCFEAGEIRVNEQLVLTCMHTLMAREHNRVAKGLSKVNPHWDDETLFQESRRINIAEIQHITFNEFLPILLGKDVMEKFGLLLNKEGYWDGYDQSVNPDVIDSFASAAYRFGHSLLPTAVERWSKAHKFIASKRLSDLIRRPYDLYRAGVFDEYLMGLMNQVAQAMDDSITQEVTNHLFKKVGARFGMDLVSFNMQRGREFGVPGYMEFRKFCGLPGADTFQELFGSMPNETIRKYESIFEHPSDVDLWSGGVSERPLPGSMLGPTFACIIATQFSYSRRGDRFWYELPNQPSSFTPEQLVEVRKSRLSRIICDNTDIIDTVQVYPMVLPDHELNPRVPCRSGIIPSMDFSKWAEHPHTFEGSSGPSRSYFTEALFSNETYADNCTLENDEVIQEQNLTDEIKAESCENNTDVVNSTTANDVENNYSTTPAIDTTNDHIQKYVVKGNKTESQEIKNQGHPKNALKRKKRATSGIFDPHPGLATLPLRIITDDDFYPIADGDIFLTSKPVIKENLKATAPQVFPEFTPVPVLPPGYLERYNVSTEINHPAANKTKEKLKNPENSESSSKSLPKTNYYDDDDDNDDDSDKQKFNNLKPKSKLADITEDKFRPYNTYDRGNEEFEEYERPQNSHPKKKPINNFKSTNGHKKIKNDDYSEDENEKDRKISTKSPIHRREKNIRDEGDEETPKSPHKTYKHYDNNKKHPQNHNFDHKHSSNNNFRPTHNSKNIPYRGGRNDNNEELDDNYENIKSTNYDSKQNFKAKYEPTIDPYNSKYAEYDKSQPSKQNTKSSSSPDDADEPAEGRRKQTYSEDKNTEDDNFQPTLYPPNTKNYFIDSTKPHFKPKEYIKSDISHKIKNEEDDSDDNNDQPLPHKSKLRLEHSDSSEDEFIPSGKLNPETYRKFIKEDDASEETAELKSHNIESNRNTFEVGETQRPPFGKYNDQRNIDEHGTPKSNNFNSEDLVDIRSKGVKPNKARNEDSSEDYEEIEDNLYKHNTDIDNLEQVHSGEHTAKSEGKPLHINSYTQKETGEYIKQPANSEESFHQAQKFPSKTKTPHNNYHDQSIVEYPKHLPIAYLEENSEEDDEKNKGAIFRDTKQKQRPEQENTKYNQEDTSEEIINQEEDDQNRKISYDNYHAPEKSDLYSKPRTTEAQKENLSEKDSNNKNSYSQGHGDEPRTHGRKENSEENVNEDDSKENRSYEFYKQQRLGTEHFKQSPEEDSEENSNHADVNIKTEIPYHSKGASDEINKEITDIGSDEKNDDDDESSNEKFSNKNYHPHDNSEEYPSRRPVAFSKESHNDGNGKANISYETYHPKGTGPARFSVENQGGDHERATISYETHHPQDTSDEYSNHTPTGFSKRTHDDGNINAKISYETHHPQDIPDEYSKRQHTAFSEQIQDNSNIKAQEYKTHHPQGSSDQYPKHKLSGLPKEYKDDGNTKAKISYETYHPPEASLNLKYRLNPSQASNENFDEDRSNKAKLISYETYHPQGNTHKYSEQISAEPRQNFNQAPVIKNGEIAYETYHPLINTNEYSIPNTKIISNEDVNQGSRIKEPKTYDQIHNEAETPTDVPKHDGKAEILEILKPLIGKKPKKYKAIYQDYNNFNPYKSLHPAVGKNLPKLPVFYNKKHSELPDLTIKTPQGNVKQQFEKIPLDYMHDSHKPRKSDKPHTNNLRPIDSEESSKDNEDVRTVEDEEDSGSNEQSKKYKYADDKIKLADINLGLPEIKLPESVLNYYDSPKNEKSEAEDDAKENYRVKEEDSDEEEEESEEEVEEEDEAPPQSEDGDDHPRSQASKQPEQDDLYGKFFNDNVDLYESFVRDNFNKEGTFEERSQKITEDPVLKKNRQDVLQHVSKNTRDAEKSKDPKYGYMWTLNYGRPL